MHDANLPLPYYRWYVTDYRASRNANRLSCTERGLYRELLDECFGDLKAHDGCSVC